MNEFSAVVKELQTKNATKDMASSASNQKKNDSGEVAISKELNISHSLSASHNGSFVSSVACQTISTSLSLTSPQSLSSVQSQDANSPLQTNSSRFTGSLVDNDIVLQMMSTADTATCTAGQFNQTLLHESMLTDKSGVPSPSLSGFSMSSDYSPASSTMLSTAQQGFCPVDELVDFTNTTTSCGSTLATLSPCNSESAVSTDPMLLNTFPPGMGNLLQSTMSTDSIPLATSALFSDTQSLVLVPQAPQSNFNLLIPSSFDFSANALAHNSANSEYLSRLDGSKCMSEAQMFDTSNPPIDLCDPVMQQLLGEVMDNSDFSATPLVSHGHMEIDSQLGQTTVSPEAHTVQPNTLLTQVQVNANNVKLSSDSQTETFTSYPPTSSEVQDILQQFI